MRRLPAQNLSQKALVVGIRMPTSSRAEMRVSMEELCRLIDTAGGEVVARAYQEIKSPHPATLVGRGKAEYPSISRWSEIKTLFTSGSEAKGIV